MGDRKALNAKRAKVIHDISNSRVIHDISNYRAK